MSEITYRFEISADVQLQISALIDKQVFPLLHQAVRAVAKQTAFDWQESVQRQKLWSGEKDAYAKSIKWDMTSDFAAVVEATYDQAGPIETGRGARDLKTMLNTSGKVRRTTDGRRFLVIPFRHNTPGNGSSAMPTSIFKLAKAMETSSITAQAQREAGQVTKLSPKFGMQKAAKQTPFASKLTGGALMTAARSYQWGGRLSRAAIKEAGMDPATQKKYAGMVRMNTSTPGGAKSSGYMTFRIMMEGSKGWIAPAQPGKFIARDVITRMQPKAAQAFEQAIKLTLKL